jgi:hypothetical protein
MLTGCHNVNGGGWFGAGFQQRCLRVPEALSAFRSARKWGLNWEKKY